MSKYVIIYIDVYTGKPLRLALFCKVTNMSEEVIIDTQVAEGAAQNANEAANNANQAAVAAGAAAVNQGQLIEAVTAAAREDADRARAESEAAAQQSEQSAELAQLTAEVLAAEVRAALVDHDKRLSALETTPTSPVVVNNDQTASPINPEEVQEEKESGMEGEQKEPARSGRKHGRRRR